MYVRRQSPSARGCPYHTHNLSGKSPLHCGAGSPCCFLHRSDIHKNRNPSYPPLASVFQGSRNTASMFSQGSGLSHGQALPACCTHRNTASSLLFPPHCRTRLQKSCPVCHNRSADNLRFRITLSEDFRYWIYTHSLPLFFLQWKRLTHFQNHRRQSRRKNHYARWTSAYPLCRYTYSLPSGCRLPLLSWIRISDGPPHRMRRKGYFPLRLSWISSGPGLRPMCILPHFRLHL